MKLLYTLGLIVFIFCIGFTVGTVKYFAFDDNQLEVFESDTKLAVRIFVRTHNEKTSVDDRRIYLNGIIRELINSHEEMLHIFPYKYIVNVDDVNRFQDQKKRFLELASFEDKGGFRE
jgi:hypothetical protein